MVTVGANGPQAIMEVMRLKDHAMRSSHSTAAKAMGTRGDSARLARSSVNDIYSIQIAESVVNTGSNYISHLQGQ
jgi:hypothetical protein